MCTCVCVCADLSLEGYKKTVIVGITVIMVSGFCMTLLGIARRIVSRVENCLVLCVCTRESETGRSAPTRQLQSKRKCGQRSRTEWLILIFLLLLLPPSSSFPSLSSSTSSFFPSPHLLVLLFVFSLLLLLLPFHLASVQHPSASSVFALQECK